MQAGTFALLARQQWFQQVPFSVVFGVLLIIGLVGASAVMLFEHKVMMSSSLAYQGQQARKHAFWFEPEMITLLNNDKILEADLILLLESHGIKPSARVSTSFPKSQNG